MLDGPAASFMMSITDETQFVFDESPLSWCWSANLRHLLIVDRTSGEMFLRRWDTRAGTNRHFRLAKSPRAAIELMDVLEKAPTPRAQDVIVFALRAFRMVRNSLPSRDGLDSIRVFNLLLAGADAVRVSRISQNDWLACRKVGDAIDRLAAEGSLQVALRDFSEATKATILDDEVLAYFLQPDSTTGCRLAPDLLLRHASGQLYQEAHLRLEQEYRQSYLPGITSDAPINGLLSKDVRFTPPALARSLVQQALSAITRHKSLKTGKN